jgi:hypothetical protein
MHQMPKHRTYRNISFCYYFKLGKGTDQAGILNPLFAMIAIVGALGNMKAHSSKFPSSRILFAKKLHPAPLLIAICFKLSLARLLRF